MVIYLLSNLGASKKFKNLDGTISRKACVMDDRNNLIKNLKLDVKEGLKVAFLASNPNSYDTTQAHAFFTKRSFDMSGFNVDSFKVIDGRNYNEAKDIIKESNLVFLTGGHVPTQNAFFKKINLAEILKNYDGIIMGQSAGSMNMANIVYCPPEDDEEVVNKDFKRYFSGLGLTDININPHFNDLKNAKVGELRLTEDIILKDSYQRPSFMLPDGSYVRIKQNKATFMGEAYLNKDGQIKKICDNDQTYTIDSFFITNKTFCQ